MSDIPEICVGCARNRMVRAKDWLGRTVEMKACTYMNTIREMSEKDWQFDGKFKTKCGFRMEK